MRNGKFFWGGVGILAATIIGSGMFALPYAASRTGLFTALFYLAVFGALFSLMHLMYADIIIRTKENHRFAGHAKLYLGDAAEWIAIIVTIIGMIFTLTVELVLSVSFINLFAPHLPELAKLFFMWGVGSLAIFWEINELAFSEFLMASAIIFITLVVALYGISSFNHLSSIPLVSFSYLFLPYGIVLFALDGRPAIPAVMGYFRNNGEPQTKARAAILLGTAIPAIVYAIFVIGILSITDSPSPDTVSGLKALLPWGLTALFGVLGAVAVFSTYIVIGRDVKKSLVYDLNFSSFWAALVVVAAPLFIYLLGFQEFIKLTGIVGGIFIGLEQSLVLLMWRKASKIPSKEKILGRIPPLLVYFSLLVFAGGIVYEILRW